MSRVSPILRWWGAAEDARQALGEPVTAAVARDGRWQVAGVVSRGVGFGEAGAAAQGGPPTTVPQE